MDRISALRNVEDALAAFEDGELSLSELERDVRGVLRTYATDFDGDLEAFRASGDQRVEGIVVLAAGPQQARERVRSLVEGDLSTAAFTVDATSDIAGVRDG
jgi:hypothetical protein